MRINTQFKSIEDIVKWQKEIKPQKALDYKRPIDTFNYCLKPKSVLGYVMRWFY